MRLTIEEFLAKHCVGADDHDYMDCRKCAMMKEELTEMLNSEAKHDGDLLRKLAQEFAEPIRGRILSEITEPAKPGEQAFLEWWGSVLRHVVATSFRENLVTVVARYCTAAWNAGAASERAAQGQRIAKLEIERDAALTERDEALREIGELRGAIMLVQPKLLWIENKTDHVVWQEIDDELAAALAGVEGKP